MDKRNLIHQAVRYALVTGAAVAMGHVSTAAAANANTPANLGKVTVTGTRIKRTTLEGAQPVLRISREQIQKSGFTNVGQLLGQLSSAGGFLNTAVNNGGSGETLINLRHLGAARNLVLVDGKRWIKGLYGETNLNTIPTAIIDHIEILRDGASAVYGSDAIAGVVNIITIKNFEGAEAHAYYGIRNDHRTGSWDGQEKQYDFTVGAGNDRGNVVFNTTYREQNAIFAAARKISRNPVAGFPGQFGSSGTPRGRFQLQGPLFAGRSFGDAQCLPYTPNAPNPKNRDRGTCDLTLINAPVQNPTTANFKNFNPATDTYNFAPENYLQEPLKDVSVYVQGHYDLLDNVTFTAKAAYIRDEAEQTIGPEPLGIGALYPNTANGSQIGISADNPYNPFGVNLVADSTDPCIAAGTCEELTLVERRTTDVGERTTDNNRDYFHINAGFNGYVNLFSHEIDWNVGFAQNRVMSTTLGVGDFNTVKLQQALGPASQCTSPCVPFDIFGGAVTRVGGPGSITAPMAAFTTFEAHNVSQTNLRDWTANISSDLVELPAGPLGLAIGWERIDNYGYSHPDSIIVSGNTTGNSGSQTNGRVVRDAEYAELNIPILGDVPGVKSLSVDVANRWSQFKRAGGQSGMNTTSYVHDSSGRLNIRYQPINDLLLRASWSQGFRSPNVSELFFGTTTGFPSVSDPCAPGSFGTYTGGPLPPNCPGGTLDVQNNAQIPTTAGGNPNLKPETSISRSAGFVYSPSQVPGLDVQADYFKIELEQPIRGIGAQNLVNGCFENNTFCNLVQVRSNRIFKILNISTNVGSELTEGIDVGLHYKFPSTPFGDFDARINGTFLKVFNITNINTATRSGFATSHLAGAAQSSSAYPKRKFNGYLDWDYGNLSVQYHIEFIDGVVEPCNAGQSACTPSLMNHTANFQGTVGNFPSGRNRLGSTRAIALCGLGAE
jgi:outer membrane receptor protein involved in Fe transport